MPSMPGHARAISPRRSRSGSRSRSNPKAAAWAPVSRRCRVMRLVSTPAIPTRPRASSQRSRCCAARKFEGSVIGAHADHAAGVAVDGFDVFVVGAHVADVREGERDELPGIGGIGQDLLIAGHGGVEDQFPHDGAGGSQPLAEKCRTVGEHEGGPGPAAKRDVHGRGGSQSVSSETRPKRLSRPGAEAIGGSLRQRSSTVKRSWSRAVISSLAEHHIR